MIRKRCKVTLQRKSYLCIPRKGIARPQSQCPRSCVCERFIYSQDRSTYFAAAEKAFWKYMYRSQTHECGNWDCGRAIPVLGIFFSNFRYVSLQWRTRKESKDCILILILILYINLSFKRYFLFYYRITYALICNWACKPGFCIRRRSGTHVIPTLARSE
jgi:hypothetical protein